MTLNTELAILLTQRSDLIQVRKGKTLEQMIKFLIDDSGFDDIHPEDRFELELALSEELMEIFC
jgi:hypothetical protein